MHVRKRLRDLAKAALVAGVPAVAGRVGGVRQYSRTLSQAPAIEVSTPTHAHSRISDDGAIAHDIELTVTSMVSLNSDAEDASDAIAEAVETAIYAALQYAPFTAGVLGVSSALELAEGAETRAAFLTTSFSVRVYADEADPQAVT